MHALIKQARERERFLRETEEARRRERERHKNREKLDLQPVFNKRLYAAKSHIVITKDAQKIMARNRQSVMSEDASMADHKLTNLELLHMKFIVEGLTFIHKGLQYVTECLAHVVTLEKYDAFQYIEKLPNEDRISCFYILSGVVEVTYDPKTRSSFNAHDTNVVYPHTTGEYLALLSPDGPEKDDVAPATVYTVEPCQFLRIDRKRFHETIDITLKRRAKEKMDYLNSTSILRTLPDDVKQRLIPTMIKQIFPAEKVIVRQEEVSKYWFLVVSGRCQILRNLYVPEVDKHVVFKLGFVDEGGFFGEEGVLEEKPSVRSVAAMGVVTCFRIKKLDFDSVAKGPLLALLREHSYRFVGDEAIKDHGYDSSVWQEYKRNEVLSSVYKKPGVMSKVNVIPNNVDVKKRPQTTLSIYQNKEMEEFIQGFPPRPKSAIHLPKQTQVRHTRRSKTAMGLRTETANEDSDDEYMIVIGDRDPSEAAVGFLPTARMVFEKVNTDSIRCEARDLINDWNRHRDLMKVQGRLGWSINPADLVVDKQEKQKIEFSTKYRDREESTSSYRALSRGDKREEAWTTPIHQANEESKKHLFVVRFRMNYLKRQLRIRKEIRKRIEERKKKTREYLENLNSRQNGGSNNGTEGEQDGDWSQDDVSDTTDDSSETEKTQHKLPPSNKTTSSKERNRESQSDSGMGSGASTPRKVDDVRANPPMNGNRSHDFTNNTKELVKRSSKQENLLRKRTSFRNDTNSDNHRKDKPIRSSSEKRTIRFQTFELPSQVDKTKRKP
ncbi:uncharacterized protein LOC144451802 [Glandiceps talaboti]